MLDISKEDLINSYKSAEMLYAESCKQPDPNVVVQAAILRGQIAQCIIDEFKIHEDQLNHFVYMVN